MIDIENLTIEKAREGLDNGDFTATELCQTYLDMIDEKNEELNAYLEVYDDVLEQAADADRVIAEGEAVSLTGIPLGIKDNILIEGKTASAGSKILENYTATYDSTVIRKLYEAGAIFLGRTNMDEFAMGSSTENSAYGPTKNPVDTTRVPGGSSGGSSAAVAGNLALAALGSETGGSVRQPASFCGKVGLKPTYGAVSRYGLIALGSSLDQIGPVTGTVADAKVIFGCIKGEDTKDSTSLPNSKWEEAENLTKSESKNLTIGVPRAEIEREGIDERVLENFNESLEVLKDIGYEVKDIEMPNMHHALAVYYVIMPAEASSNLARFDGVKYGLHVDGKDLLEDYNLARGTGFGDEPARRIMLGTYVLSAGYYDAYYRKANAVRQVIRDEFADSFQDVDIIATPTTATPAFKIGEKADDPLAMYMQDIFTVPANISGVPALSVPSGSVSEGGVDLPLGLQLLAPHQQEDRLFVVGEEFEKALF